VTVIIVTGASRGIGRGLAVGLAQPGAQVVCAARSGGIHDTVDQIHANGGDAFGFECDIGVESDIAALVEATLAHYGRVDVLVNNAMTPTRASFDESTLDQWDESMRVNVRSLYLFTRAVVEPMRAQGGGSIINISSGGAEHATQPFMPPGYLFYVVAKAALERFTTAIAPELRPLGINVNALRPGAVKTEGTMHEFGEDHDWTGWSEPASVVPAVAFLAAQIGTDFTGRIVDVSNFGTAWGK
jgi:NAD(P)-dependent dehydrogenase (short-subunit alcohol dehydrogenase family)